MRLTRADLRALGQRPREKPTERDPTMAPTRGVTPKISGRGRRTYIHAEAYGNVIVVWDDDRERVPVVWIPPGAWTTWEYVRDRLGVGR